MLSLAIALLFVATNHCEAALDPSSKLNTPTFSSVPAVDLQPLFEIDVPWLGADIATSVPLGGLPGVYLWLHGDTLIGKMSDGVRVVQGMPRNSVAILNVSSSGQPVSPYQHYIRSNPKEAQHFGFFSPPEPSQWYWPTAGISIGEDLYVVSMRIEAGGSGLFPFATAGFDVLKISSPSTDPMSWPSPSILTIPHVSNNFTVGNAVGSVGDGFIYLLGGGGPKGQTGFITRIAEKDFSGGNWEQLQYWMGNGTWEPHTGLPSFSPALLFDYVPSETTLVYHPVMSSWFIVVANTFISNQINIRTAPEVTGPWSDLIPVYDIPAELLAGGAFCYAGKAHPELSPSGAPQFVFSYMCNTPTIPELLNRTDVYTPRLVRTTITLNN